MAAGLIDIKRRIKSVTNTRKITKAMGLVATSKLRRVRMELDVNNNYFTSLEKVAKQLVGCADLVDPTMYIKGNDSKGRVFIVISSDSGLCGGYNASVALTLSEYIGNDKANCSVISVGQKGISYIKKHGFTTVGEYVEIPDIPTIKETKVIYEHVFKLFNNKEVGEVNIVYTKFKSPVTQEIKIERLLPISLEKENIDGYLVEPETSETLEGAFDVYLKGKIMNSLLTSKASEQASRMNAMDSASKNADDLLDSLSIKYN